MPESALDPSHWRERALESLDQYLCDHCGGRRLSSSELGRYESRAVTHGWRLPGDDEGQPVLDVLVDGDFPYTVARIALPNGPRALEWPHVESDGVLCVLPGQSTISTRDPAGVAEAVLSDAQGLTKACRDRGNVGDFRNEFLSYWSLAVDDKARSFISLISPTGPSREIVIWRGKAANVCADDRATLNGWLIRWGVTKPKAGFSFDRGMMLWLPKPMTPDEYPHTAGDVLKLAKDHAPGAVAMLEGCVLEGDSKTEVIIGAPTDHGTCFVGLTLTRPAVKELSRGFRPGHLPRAIQVSRCFGANRVERGIAQRADHDWVHGRGHDARQADLKHARVLLLGCGAVGAGVARLLVQSGVGHLTLVDHQALDWPNIGRHALGAREVRRNKAVALAEALCRDFPHLPGIEGRELRFGLRATSLIDELPMFDLVICATGDWGTDVLLNDLQQSRAGIPPVIYAWLEPQATAAHAVYIPKAENQACLRCGFDDVGRPNMPVTEWPDGEPFLQEPACGAVFSPFGAVELVWTQALVVELALDALLGKVTHATDRVWIGRREAMEATGSQWGKAWCEAMSSPEAGGMIVQYDWMRSRNCPICSKVVVT